MSLRTSRLAAARPLRVCPFTCIFYIRFANQRLYLHTYLRIRDALWTWNEQSPFGVSEAVRCMSGGQ